MQEVFFNTVIIFLRQLELIENFFAPNGSKCLLFYYEERPLDGEFTDIKIIILH